MLIATVLAIGSAGLHATWNLMVKSADDGELASAGQFGAAGLLGLAALSITGLPPLAAVPWLATSGLIHLVYVRCLVRAYRSGDFSLAYPLARGGGALLAALGGALVLADPLRPLGWVGAGIVALGLLSLVDPHAAPATIGWAAATAATIGAYTVVDSHGVRVAGAGASYVFALMATASTGIVGAVVATGRGRELVSSVRRDHRRHLAAGALVTVAYGMALLAVRHAPVGYVAMLRESSVVIGAGIGWVVLHERLAARRLASTVVVLAGLVVLVVAQR